MRLRRRGMKNRLLLNKSVYTDRAIQSAIQAFASIAQISCRDQEAYYELIFQRCQAQTAVTMQEFGNYVLVESIKDAGGLYD